MWFFVPAAALGNYYAKSLGTINIGKEVERGNPTEVRTKEGTDSASVGGTLDSLKGKHRDMSANWNFCVIEQETRPVLI